MPQAKSREAHAHYIRRPYGRALEKSVALIGFSTSGKSTIGEAVKNLCARKKFTISYRDSDYEIGAKYGGHIADIYGAHSHADACSLIEREERQFLNNINPVIPTLVVPGPNTILREPEWTQFLRRAKPIIYYLEIGALVCYQRLYARHQGLRKQYNNSPRVLSVNLGALGELNSHGEFVDYDTSEGQRRISENMREQVSRYALIADPQRTFSAIMSNAQKRAVETAIAKDLGLLMDF